MHFDLRHALVRAYRDRAVCIVNSFRAELTRKRALLALLTDDQVTAKFPAAERHVIKASAPWTRLVTQSRKIEYRRNRRPARILISKNRERLVLRPNDGSLDAEAPSYDGVLTPERTGCAPFGRRSATATSSRSGRTAKWRLSPSTSTANSPTAT